MIPVENQVREFDPKLLLARVCAQRGFTALIGARREIEFRVASMQRGIYLSKSMTMRSAKIFRILRTLGHEIVAWDEEALVHLPPDVYFTRRLCPDAMKHVSHLLAWGQDNVELFEQYPHLGNRPIHATGNPRNDFLRPELRGLFSAQAEAFRAEHGDFVLINTNFNHVNAFYPVENLFLPVGSAGEEPRRGRSSEGMALDYAIGLRDHKQALFEHFQRLIPELEKRFPQINIVVRPHPTEGHAVYEEIARRCTRVRVTNQGNVVPWLLAAKALVHNGCTTGVEAYVLGVPALSYRPHVDDRYDDGFYRLPNRASHQCFAFDELVDALQNVFAGTLGPAGGAERKALVDRYLAAQEGPLAVERIADLLEAIAAGRPELPRPPLGQQLAGWFAATKRRWVKSWKGLKRGAHHSPEFQRHRYPPISVAQVRSRLAAFSEALPGGFDVQVDQVAGEIFRLRRVEESKP
jgi:surface carbohydrate biosynthesis protein